MVPMATMPNVGAVPRLRLLVGGVVLVIHQTSDLQVNSGS
jgi:hypothetical protein